MPKRIPKISDPELLRSLEEALSKGALSLPDACRVIRARKGWTQEQLAVRAGVALKVIKQLESGQGNPTLDSLGRVAGVAGLQIGLLRPASVVRIGPANEHIRREKAAHRTDLRSVASGKLSLKQLRARNALQGSDFTIDLPILA